MAKNAKLVANGDVHRADIGSDINDTHRQKADIYAADRDTENALEADKHS